MKLLLIFPNFVNRDEFGDPSDPPIGLASIAALLEEKGYEIGIIDANAENLSLVIIKERLKSFNPDCVGISCNYSPLHNPTIEIAKMIKKIGEIPVVVGGNHATAMAEVIIKDSEGSIDFVAHGEGESVLPDLLKAIEKETGFGEVRGITFLDDGKIRSNPNAPLIDDLNRLPLPAYHLLPMERYKRYNIVSIRGCPYNCSYCASNVISKRRVRFRSKELVVNEIEHLLVNYGQKNFWFSDDTFISNPKRTMALLDEMERRSLNINWSCLTRVNRITKALLEKMKGAGCNYISYGIESGNQAILDGVGKGIEIEEILATLRLTYEVGIRYYGFFMVGFPGESWETIMDSFKLIANSKLDGAAFNILIPLPGTRLMKELLEKELIKIGEMNWDHLFARTPDGRYDTYSANLASRWSKVSGEELIEACKIGQRLPEIFKGKGEIGGKWKRK